MCECERGIRLQENKIFKYVYFKLSLVYTSLYHLYFRLLPQKGENYKNHL